MFIDLFSLFERAIDAVMPEKVVPAHLKREENILYLDGTPYDLARFERCYLCGSGKAADAMAPAAERILGPYCNGGVIVSPEVSQQAHVYRHFRGTHPLPSQHSVTAGEALIEQFASATENDLILFLLSGGTSALIERPVPPITIEDMTATTAILLENGYSIDEINSVRKHLSLIKGGRLAGTTKATVAVLVISDVIGDDLHTIGSAPLYCDASSYGDVRALLDARSLFNHLPPSVQQVIQNGETGRIAETPKTPLPHTRHFMIASNILALEAAAAAARSAGLNVVLDREPLTGDVSEGVESVMDRFEQLEENTLYLRGGECTVVVEGSGKGGRNQHFALALMLRLKNSRPYRLIAAGTDGIDGNSDAAGAMVSDRTYSDALKLGIDPQLYMDAFDSNGFFEAMGAAIKTGYTRTNVMDIVLLYKG